MEVFQRAKLQMNWKTRIPDSLVQHTKEGR